MNVIHLMKLAATLTIGIIIAFAGSILTWFHVSHAELKKTVFAAKQVVRANEFILDEARITAERARPFLLQPCTPQTRTELSRLAIGIERVRIINLFIQSNLVCSSWDGSRNIIMHIPAAPENTVTLLTDEHISPGMPIIVLDRYFPEGVVTVSMTTLEPAMTLQRYPTHRLLHLRAGEQVLTADNQLMTPGAGNGDESLHAIHSVRYPFSVEYSGSQTLSLRLYLREGALLLLLSMLLGGAVSIGLWRLVFRPKTVYEQLSRAIKRGEIVPWYQPVVDTLNGVVIGVEVLARYVKPDATVISPDQFIPVAESSDLIIPLTRSLMTQASTELASLSGIRHPLHVGVNITQAHVLEADFVEECLKFTSEFKPGCIKLNVELTEREPFDNSALMLRRLQQLHRNGITVSLDDFGTGHANLEYLSEVDVDIIKIDRAFIGRIGQAEAGERLLASLIEMAGFLNLVIIAEGVETVEQKMWLEANGVSWHQGYLYSPPVPLSQLEKIVKYGIDCSGKLPA